MAKSGLGVFADGHGFPVVKKALEGFGEGVDRLKALIGVDVAGPVGDLAELLRDMLFVLYRLGDACGEEDLEEAGAVVAHPACEQCVEGRAQQIDVGALVLGGKILLRHLGGQVAGRAANALAGGAGGEERMVILEANGDAPVEDVDLTKVADHDIFGLDITVDHAAAVGEAQGIADLEEELDMVVEISRWKLLFLV